jgi:allantoicase
MAEKIPVGTKKKFGPYKGSAQNGGRPIYVTKTKTKDGWETTSKNKARDDYETKSGRKLAKDVDVDHKNNNHSDDRKSNLRPLKHGANTAKENKRRAGKK